MTKRHHKRFTDIPIFTILICVIITFFWIYGSIKTGINNGGGHNILNTIFSYVDSKTIEVYGAISKNTINQGHWLNFIATEFTHIHFSSYILDIIALLVIGTLLEKHLGILRLLPIYLGSGFAGQLTNLTFLPNTLTTGASPSTLGISGAFISYFLSHPHFSKIVNKKYIGFIVIYIVSQLAFSVYNTHSLNPGQITSLISGAAIGLLLSKTTGIKGIPAL